MAFHKTYRSSPRDTNSKIHCTGRYCMYTYQRSNIYNVTVKKKKKKIVFKTNVTVDYLFKQDSDVCLCDKRVFIRFLIYREQIQELQTFPLVSYTEHAAIVNCRYIIIIIAIFFSTLTYPCPLTAPHDRRVHYTPKPVQTVLQCGFRERSLNCSCSGAIYCF